jgi:hypothetical protein
MSRHSAPPTATKANPDANTTTSPVPRLPTCTAGKEQGVVVRTSDAKRLFADPAVTCLPIQLWLLKHVAHTAHASTRKQGVEEDCSQYVVHNWTMGQLRPWCQGAGAQHSPEALPWECPSWPDALALC